MASRDTVLIVAVLGIVSVIFALFMIGATSILSPQTARLPDWSREDDVIAKYVNETATITLREGQKSGSIIVALIKPNGRVVVDTPSDAVAPDVLVTGDAFNTCEHFVKLLNVTSTAATFEITKGKYCDAPWWYCWHMYQAETYDDYIASLSAS